MSILIIDFFKYWWAEKKALENIIDSKSKEIGKLENDAHAYKRIIRNLLSIEKIGVKGQIMSCNENALIVLKQKEFLYNLNSNDRVYEFNLILFDTNLGKPVCTANVEAHEISVPLFCNGEEMKCNDKTIYIQHRKVNLVNLDTLGENRKGYGSFLLQYLVQFCRFNRYKKLYGGLHLHTPIGIDSLKHFYVKNGFIVTETTFYMNF